MTIIFLPMPDFDDDEDPQPPLWFSLAMMVIVFAILGYVAWSCLFT